VTAQKHRIAVIGDVGGHRDALWAELVRLGADPATGALPDDLVAIQVGDLVHRGPDSAGVVRLVDRYLREQPGQWVQLIGNHEAQYVRPPVFEWPETLDDDTAGLVRDWWTSGRMLAAATFTVDGQDFLATHAGLTVGFWRDCLGGPAHAAVAAEALNTLARAGDPMLFRVGEMLGLPTSMSAGPLWAAAPTELLLGWLSVSLPFNQIHGHSTFYHWGESDWRCASPLQARTEVDESRAHETTTYDTGRIIGVDPGHGHAAQPAWEAWVGHGHLTTP
jgi:Calcineurin-like phosphoesterase